jgi:sugar phosphate isomerase/epimerase
VENLNRRRFLGAAIGTGAAAAAAGGLAPAAGAHGNGWGWGRGHGGSVPRNRIGIQLWSLKRVMTDPASAESMFAYLARVGYSSVEPYGENYGLTPVQLRRMLDRYRLQVPSRHDQDFGVLFSDAWEDDFKQRLETAQVLGQQYTGVAWFSEEWRTEEKFKFIAQRYNEAGALASAEGLTFFHHNHDFEFSIKQADGTPIYDILLEETDPDLVKFELDLYWIVVGGESPVHYLAGDPARYPLYHVKDKTWRDRPNADDWEDVGPGSIDFPDIFDAGDGRRLDKHFIVEHDHPPLSHPDDPDAERKTALAGVQYLRTVRW